jgi:hypothetical protein
MTSLSEETTAGLGELRESIKRAADRVKEASESLRRAEDRLNAYMLGEFILPDGVTCQFIQDQVNACRAVLAGAQRNYDNTLAAQNMFIESKNKILQLQTEENFQNSSAHSSFNKGFEEKCRLDLQRELWKLFQVGFADPKYFFRSSRYLLDQDALQIVKKNYQRKVSGEIDIYLYANPSLPWKLHESENTSQLYPFTAKVETQNWSPAINSLNQSNSYGLETPYTSEDNLNEQVRDAQNNLSAVATKYMIFEVTHSNRNLTVKLKQLEAQLAYVIIRYFLRRSKEIPSDNLEFKEFIAREVLNLIAFAGVVLIKGGAQKLLSQAHKVIFAEKNPYPALASLYRNGRLCYFYGDTFATRMSSVEEKLESLATKEENSTRLFENMEEFYDALRENDCDDEDVQIICDVCLKQRIKANVLHRLTDEDLEKAGVAEMGLRKAILAVLEK